MDKGKQPHEYTAAERIANGNDVPRDAKGIPLRCAGCWWREGGCWSPWIAPISTRVVPLRQIREDGSKIDWSYRRNDPVIIGRLARFGLPPEAALTHGTERTPHSLTADVLQRCVVVDGRRPNYPETKQPDAEVIGFADPLPRPEFVRSACTLEID